jgi:hypothetical protein
LRAFWRGGVKQEGGRCRCENGANLFEADLRFAGADSTHANAPVKAFRAVPAVAAVALDAAVGRVAARARVGRRRARAAVLFCCFAVLKGGWFCNAATKRQATERRQRQAAAKDTARRL